MKPPIRLECYAFIRPDGSVLCESTWDTPRPAWHIGLGWPGGEGILEAKRTGYRVVKVRLEEIGE